MASADNVNYAIRPNKTVERKTRIRNLGSSRCQSITSPDTDTSGLVLCGSSISCLHINICLLTDMISIEEERVSLGSRAKFNKPYACVRVELGESDRRVAPTSNSKKSNFLSWLDYDTSIDGPVFEGSYDSLPARALTGSLLIVTINAHKE